MFRFCAAVLLSAASLLAHAGSWTTQALGGFSQVDIYTPDSYSSIGQGRALLIVLHGCTQAISAFRGANLEDAAEQYGMVVAVPDAVNKAGFACWSYWQGTISRNSGDYRNLIQLANALTGDSARQIDGAQVYIAGLSSGATFAHTTACLAPDIFAGVGVSAGPSIGTSSSGAIGTCESAPVASRCRSYAGSFASHFSTQLGSFAQARNDTTVNTCYNRQNAEGMADVYGVSELPGTTQVGDGSGRTVEQSLWQDQRLSLIWFDNVGHAWSGGPGASGSFISGNSINYASYLGAFFSANNRRVDRNQAPELVNLQAVEENGRARVSGRAMDAENALAQTQINISRLDDGTPVASFQASPAGNGEFSALSPALANDLYEISAMAFDQEGAGSLPLSISLRIGPPPPPAAPVLSELSAVSNGQCVAIGGRVSDVNQDLAQVSVAVDGGAPATAQVQGLDFTYSQCDLAGGTHTASVVARDQGGLEAMASVNFTIDAGVTALLQAHIDAGRLDYTAYANCYLVYGAATAFRLDEVDAGGAQCRWSDGASCVGPVQACSGGAGGDSGGGDGGGDSGGGGGTPPATSCTESSNYNYYHKVAGRAYSSGPTLSPNYFAQGSNDPLSGSTWGLSTLHQFANDANWYAGTCP